MNQIILAVPGSGKTTAIAEYITRMAKDGIIQGEATYAVTFTREAAAELRAKIKVNGVTASTIHSLAHGFLVAANGPLLGTELIDDMFYDALLIKAVQVLPGLNIDLLAIDEAQDLSPIQFYFLREVAKIAKHLLVVGDPNQAIFSFQGSDPKFMNMFKDVKVDTQINTMDKSYRLPREIASYVNSTFNQGVKIVPANEGGKVEALLKKEDLITSCITERINSNTGILVRTNAEIVTILRAAGAKADSINYSIPLSAHPFVTFATAVMQMGTSISGYELLQSANLLGGITWAGSKALRRLADKRFTRKALNDIFGPGRATTDMDPREIPPVSSKIRKDIYNLIEVLDSYDSFYGSFSSAAVNAIIAKLRSDNYLIEDFWKSGGVNDSELAEAVRRRITTNSELYHVVDKGSSTNLMTIHASKGKEFKNVVVPVNIRSINIYDQEEVRILFVACTRAIESLCVFIPESYTHDRSRANIVDLMIRSTGGI